MTTSAVWLLIGEIAYGLLLLFVCFRIVLDTRSVSKTLAYLLLVIFLPVVGIIFYFSFGINYRKRKMYHDKLESNSELLRQFKNAVENIEHPSREELSSNLPLVSNSTLTKLLINERTGYNPLFAQNETTLFINGEELYPEMLEELKKAKKYIHFEYYAYHDDRIGNQIKDILVAKAAEGVDVRFIYDDYGCRGIRRRMEKSLKEGGVQAYPFHKVTLKAMANRMNYRNHRKIVIIDGEISYVGGINVSDKYINYASEPEKLYWRDTHMKIRGRATYMLQYIFLSDWNFCAPQPITDTSGFFPEIAVTDAASSTVQIVASGPDSDVPGILYSVIQAINLAKEEILITTPYYIPDENLQEAIILAALSGVDVKLLIPGVSDSIFVDFASKSYFEDLLRAGVKIYAYRKGFVHAKTFVTDRQLASVGTANLDSRSFDLNFEVSAVVYDTDFARKLADSFFDDLHHAEQIHLEEWVRRPRYKQLIERVLRLTSPLM